MEKIKTKSIHPSLIHSNMPDRTMFDMLDVESILSEIREVAILRTRQKGFGNLASDFETVGTLHQEFNEFTDAIHEKQSADAKCKELYDIIFSAMLGILLHKSVGKSYVPRPY